MSSRKLIAGSGHDMRPAGRASSYGLSVASADLACKCKIWADTSTAIQPTSMLSAPTGQCGSEVAAIIIEQVRDCSALAIVGDYSSANDRKRWAVVSMECSLVVGRSWSDISAYNSVSEPPTVRTNVYSTVLPEKQSSLDVVRVHSPAANYKQDPCNATCAAANVATISLTMSILWLYDAYKEDTIPAPGLKKSLWTIDARRRLRIDRPGDTACSEDGSIPFAYAEGVATSSLNGRVSSAAAYDPRIFEGYPMNAAIIRY
ncbi:hypothetical protein T310_5159 [Rasamsonia emersonii CBS 393.64]|uniref:Uncharacterized protein n=1 Tax=Rasamsonia emersonii (strain ATCC 16479 / CBS 393.64 / IMI 116815) TaxID=1408163 RepID=A0A0F4YSH5_RASE3|nr:hypothetical protein T310_5159 [Rasamsonia emersonii CBS 393.64]KKA20796.1 hypothetical protein T310_5159 [Rasamsonia emersonii CBS 393.64]